MDPIELAWRRKLTAVKHFYGISGEDFLRVWNEQGKCCAICKESPEELRDVVLDHDHNTLAFRGILCRWCNVILGKAKDKADYLENAASYVRTADTGLVCAGKSAKMVEHNNPRG